MGVITTCSLSAGTILGPIPPTLTLSDPAVLIGHRTCDTLPDIHTIKINISEYCHDVRLLAEWVPYIQSARSSQEQNMDVILRQTNVNDVTDILAPPLMYFRVTRDINKYSELRIWYSEEFAALIHVPECKEEYQQDDGFYSCPECGDLFRFPNSLRAHMRFRCKLREEQHHVINHFITNSSQSVRQHQTEINRDHKRYLHGTDITTRPATVNSPTTSTQRGLIDPRISPGCNPMSQLHNPSQLTAERNRWDIRGLRAQSSSPGFDDAGRDIEDGSSLYSTGGNRSSVSPGSVVSLSSPAVKTRHKELGRDQAESRQLKRRRSHQVEEDVDVTGGGDSDDNVEEEEEGEEKRGGEKERQGGVGRSEPSPKRAKTAETGRRYSIDTPRGRKSLPPIHSPHASPSPQQFPHSASSPSPPPFYSSQRSAKHEMMSRTGHQNDYPLSSSSRKSSQCQQTSSRFVRGDGGSCHNGGSTIEDMDRRYGSGRDDGCYGDDAVQQTKTVDNEALCDEPEDLQMRSAFQRVDKKQTMSSPTSLTSSPPTTPSLHSPTTNSSILSMQLSSHSTTSHSAMSQAMVSLSVMTPTSVLNMSTSDRRTGNGNSIASGMGIMGAVRAGVGMTVFSPPHLLSAARMAPPSPLVSPQNQELLIQRLHQQHPLHPMGVENSAYYAAAAATAAAAAAAINGLHYINNNNNNGINNNAAMCKNLKAFGEAGNAGLLPGGGGPAEGRGGGGGLPFIYRSVNPVLDKMIHAGAAAAAMAGGRLVLPPAPGVQRHLTGNGNIFPGAAALNLAQNWCAKCNTSFRMTSDLVYHMRSHHKREFDPVRKKKDDKLKCDVCGETFRERHHLTRHMTSHT